jgi:hypothetical protein
MYGRGDMLQQRYAEDHPVITRLGPIEDILVWLEFMATPDYVATVLARPGSHPSRQAVPE